MNPQEAVDLGREAMATCLIVGAPLLAVALIIGILIGVLQAMTQVQDQTVAFIPRFIVMAVALGVGLPWMADRLLDYSKSMFEKPVIHMPRGSVDS